MNVELEAIYNIMKNMNSSGNCCHQYISQRLGHQGNAPPLLLTTVCKHLGTEETSCWTFGRGISSHSCPIQYFSCSTVLHLLCRVLCLTMDQMLTADERSGMPHTIRDADVWSECWYQARCSISSLVFRTCCPFFQREFSILIYLSTEQFLPQSILN